MNFNIPTVRGFLNKAAGGEWTPADLSGLKFWVRSDQGFTPSNGSTSATWNDLSSNGCNLTANKTGNYITKESAVLGSKDGIKFTNNAYFTSAPNVMSFLSNTAYPNNFIIVFVYKYYGAGNTQEAFYRQDQQGFYLYNGTWNETYGYGTSAINSEMDSVNAMILTGSVYSHYTITNNRYGETLLTPFFGPTVRNMSSATFNIGSTPDFGGNILYALNTYFGEIIVARPASTSDITNLKTYLNNYWNFNYQFS